MEKRSKAIDYTTDIKKLLAYIEELETEVRILRDSSYHQDFDVSAIFDVLA